MHHYSPRSSSLASLPNPPKLTLLTSPPPPSHSRVDSVPSPRCILLQSLSPLSLARFFENSQPVNSQPENSQPENSQPVDSQPSSFPASTFPTSPFSVSSPDLASEAHPLQTLRRRECLPSSPTLLWRINQGFGRCITWDMDGRVLTWQIWGPGDWVAPALHPISPLQIECLTPVQASSQLITTALAPNHGQLLLQQHLAQMEALIHIHSNPIVLGRLQFCFRWLASRFGRPYSHGPSHGSTGLNLTQGLSPSPAQLITIPLTHQDLADLVGTTRVTVTRLLAELRRTGWLSLSPYQRHQWVWYDGGMPTSGHLG